MKSFQSILFDPSKCREELAEFSRLLDTNAELEERMIVQFFRDRVQLSGSLGLINPNVQSVDRIAFEYPLFGDFVCDLVVGDSTSLSYCFIEFEETGPRSVFVERNRETPEWASRFEHGFSQIIDWFWKLDDMSRTGDFEHRFGGRSIHWMACLIVGRKTFGTREAERLTWRQNHVVVNSRHIICMNYEDLHETLGRRIARSNLQA
jgi:hypothetical protein